jgi:hypothetical protein
VAAAEPLLLEPALVQQDDACGVVDESAWDGYGWRSLGA